MRLADVAAWIAERAWAAGLGPAHAGRQPPRARRTRDLLDAAAADDTDLAWRLLARRAELGEAVDEAVASLLERDPDPEARFRALAVRASQPLEAGKTEAWTALLDERSVPAGGPIREVASRFWRPGQTELLLPWAHRWFDQIADLRRPAACSRPCPWCG